MLQKDKVMQQEWGLPLPLHHASLHDWYRKDITCITGWSGRNHREIQLPGSAAYRPAFPVLMKQLELKLADGELSPANNVPSRYTPKD